ncbi:hypothetical protein FISHEDRAFT_70715 [Fistulina hepatica ATCC 64428]|uniref:Uncharacterized protein n=1 Tax=Fistulina hepatica ATCC 64428 TaxID=1128425 RepID=A0A0D7AHY1_9AGAR|nr:hypothetical protein FISHEDRAFT_70715 [Fistulina hepatica ATCC 64428]
MQIPRNPLEPRRQPESFATDARERPQASGRFLRAPVNTLAHSSRRHTTHPERRRGVPSNSSTTLTCYREKWDTDSSCALEIVQARVQRWMRVTSQNNQTHLYPAQVMILRTFREVVSPFPITPWVTIIAEVISSSHQVVLAFFEHANTKPLLEFPGRAEDFPANMILELVSRGPSKISCPLYRSRTVEGDTVVLVKNDAPESYGFRPHTGPWSDQDIEAAVRSAYVYWERQGV